jgi:hypothetical protein
MQVLETAAEVPHWGLRTPEVVRDDWALGSFLRSYTGPSLYFVSRSGENWQRSLNHLVARGHRHAQVAIHLDNTARQTQHTLFC